MSYKTSGCWTCRIRHVKCDLETPHCRECSSRCISCHGYGAQPSWMDGGSLEAAERSRIKTAVKENFRRVRKRQNLARRSEQLPKVAAEKRARVRQRVQRTSDVREQSPITPTPAPLELSVPQESHDTIICSSEAAQSSPHETRSGSFAPVPTGSTHSLDAHEAGLLMHYFDRVFPWQYPYYNAESRIGNRGWLLQLLASKRGPLYYATLSLSAFHQNALSGIDDQHLQNQKAFSHHSTALHELCLFLSSERSVELHQDPLLLAEFLACSLMLVSFEILLGGQSNWQLHLDAVASIISQTSPSSFTESGADNPDTQVLSLSKQHGGANTGLEFLYSQALWFDLLACVSTSEGPQLPYKSWLAVEGFNMADLMGCENQILSLIGDLAELRQWKEKMDGDGMLSTRELVSRAQVIETNLEEQIESLQSGDDQDPAKTISNWVSHIFALGALVMTHTVASGPLPALPEIRHAVERSISVLQAKHSNCSLQCIVWPLCIIGCMAQSQHHSFFDTFMMGMIAKCKGFGNSATVLQIIKKCWELQKYGRYDCMTTMAQMRIHALLV